MTIKRWSKINKTIKECLQSEKPLECLLNLFQETKDGWVAFHIGNLLRDQGKKVEAINYYKIAHEKLPLAKYKKLVKNEIDKVEAQLTQEKDVLFIVSCTKNKIWNEKEHVPKYVPAQKAYTGNIMKKWLESKEAKIYPWLIFSSKYGIIEPDHPIRNYDIHFIYDPGAISEKTILRQIIYHEFNGFKVKDFKKVHFVGSQEYYRKLKLIFAKAGMELYKYEL